MRICLVHEEYPEETAFGGIATYQKNVAEECVRQGHEVFVICRGLDRDKCYIENGVNVNRIFVEKTDNQIQDYKEYRNRVAKILNEMQEKNMIDIIEVPDWGAETIFFEDNRKIPLVVRLHTPLKVWLKYNKNDFGPITDLMLKWEEKMLRAADYITCCSFALKNIIVKDFEIEEDKIQVTPNPANITSFYRDNLIKKEDVLLYVGSVEERKGVIVLAEALDEVFEKYPNLCVRFIGKDTNRNNKNISTVKYIKELVSDKYQDNLEFLGQIPNEELNKYFNSAKLAVFPSLFDNFPYVVLESMSTGINIIGSRNSGMVEMLNDETSIYETGNTNDLASKIIQKLESFNENEIIDSYIYRVKNKYNSYDVCKNLLHLYEDVVRDYNFKNISKADLEFVLSKVLKDKKILNFEREKGGVANLVFKIETTDNEKYVIKKYEYDINFELSNILYDLYEKSGVLCLRPINREPILYNDFKYNVFEYIERDDTHEHGMDYYAKLLLCDRNVDKPVTILEKCLKYYEYLKEQETYGILKKTDVINVVNLFTVFKDDPLLKEQYINHGDISKGNVLHSDNKEYVIDFDEVCVTTLLYDFAVIVIKMFVENEKIDFEKFNILKEYVKEKYTNYSDDEFIKIVKFYLCKILLEKFYLHLTGKINLYSERQLKDDYRKYLILLEDLNNYKI